MLFIAVGLLLVLIAASVAGWFYFSRSTESVITARRILPKHCMPGQPFPVIIEVAGTPDRPVTLILRESCPKRRY